MPVKALFVPPTWKPGDGLRCAVVGADKNHEAALRGNGYRMLSKEEIEKENGRRKPR